MRKKILLFTLSTIILLTSQVWAMTQAGQITGTALGLGSNYYVKALVGATVQACVNSGTSSTLTCTTPVQAYSDPLLANPISTVTTDSNGNYSFYVNVASTVSFD